VFQFAPFPKWFISRLTGRLAFRKVYEIEHLGADLPK
jgi:hypothetical protein